MLARLAGLAWQSRLHGKFSSRLAGRPRDAGIPASRAEIFPCNREVNFSVFRRRAEIPANRASPAKWASPPHVIGPLDTSKKLVQLQF